MQGRHACCRTRSFLTVSGTTTFSFEAPCSGLCLHFPHKSAESALRQIDRMSRTAAAEAASVVLATRGLLRRGSSSTVRLPLPNFEGGSFRLLPVYRAVAMATDLVRRVSNRLVIGYLFHLQAMKTAEMAAVAADEVARARDLGSAAGAGEGDGEAAAEAASTKTDSKTSGKRTEDLHSQTITSNRPLMRLTSMTTLLPLLTG